MACSALAPLSLNSRLHTHQRLEGQVSVRHTGTLAACACALPCRAAARLGRVAQRPVCLVGPMPLQGQARPVQPSAARHAAWAHRQPGSWVPQGMGHAVVWRGLRRAWVTQWARLQAQAACPTADVLLLLPQGQWCVTARTAANGHAGLGMWCRDGCKPWQRALCFSSISCCSSCQVLLLISSGAPRLKCSTIAPWCYCPRLQCA
jgi:hypothetical protein